MSELHITTTGLSLLTNFCKARGLDEAVALRKAGALRDFLRADPLRASAELNALDGRTHCLAGRHPDLAVALVYTETAKGKVVASLLEGLLREHCGEVAKIKLREIALPAQAEADLDLAERRAGEGLLELRAKVQSHVERYRARHPGGQVFFNCTGGYKAEIAVLYELGRFLRVPVYYMHETYRRPICLP
jgi:putative CRISPR-associated protein (TIGR02619 family)